MDDHARAHADERKALNRREEADRKKEVKHRKRAEGSRAPGTKRLQIFFGMDSEAEGAKVVARASVTRIATS